MMKKWYVSKTLWVALIAFAGALLQEFGIISAPIGPDWQLMILSVIAFILRLITKEPIEFQAKK